MHMMDDLNLVSLANAAQRIGITRQRLHKLVANGQIRAIRLGHYLYIEKSELERFMAQPRGKPHAPRSTLDKISIDKRQ